MIRHQNSAIRNHKWPSSEPPKPEKKEMNAFDNPIEVQKFPKYLIGNMKNKATNKYGIISLWIFDLINENNLPIGLRPKTAPDKKKNNGM